MADTNAGIDPRAEGDPQGGSPRPYHEASFAKLRVVEAWGQYGDRLTWGRGQCLAVLDDGCDLSVPEWRALLPWGPKVIATWNSIDGNDDCTPVPPGYHGTSVGWPSSLNHHGVRGIAYNNQVAHVRCVSIVHLTEDETVTMAAALQWVIDHHEQLNITAVNLSPLDDQQHTEPMPTAIDAKLRALRERNIWVGAPCGNHHYTDGISWPACQPDCFGIGAVDPAADGHVVHLDRFTGTDLLVAATATSSSNAYAAASFMVLREAVELAGYPWQQHGPTLPDAIMSLFQRTGVPVHDPATGLVFRSLDLLAALDAVLGG